MANNLEDYTDQELLEISGISGENDLKSLSDEELMKAAGVHPSETKSTSMLENFLAQFNPMLKENIPQIFTGKESLPGDRTFFGNIFERPGASIRAGIRAIGDPNKKFIDEYIKGANQPETIESFQDQFIRESMGSLEEKSPSVAVNFSRGFMPSAVGLLSDIVSNPADLIIELATLGSASSSVASRKATASVAKNKSIAKIVDSPITKAIRPTVSGKNTARQVKTAKENARLAVDTILENKHVLRITDEAGEIVNRLPKNLDEFSQAIAQTKASIFNQYSSLSSKAGKEYRILDLDGIADELSKVVNNVSVKDTAPETYNYAKQLSKTLKDRGFYSINEAEEVLKVINNRLQSYYRNPDATNSYKMTIDALYSNRLRNQLDDVIMRESGKSYGALKRRYGALKSIEKDVNRRLIVDARKNSRGLIDFTDIFSAGDIVKGVASGNPSNIARGGISYLTKRLIKGANNPNRKINIMFKQMDNLKRQSVLRTFLKDPRVSIPAITESIRSDKSVEINSLINK